MQVAFSMAPGNKKENNSKMLTEFVSKDSNTSRTSLPMMMPKIILETLPYSMLSNMQKRDKHSFLKDKMPPKHRFSLRQIFKQQQFDSAGLFCVVTCEKWDF